MCPDYRDGSLRSCALKEVFEMASCRQKHKRIQKRKVITRGKARKRVIRAKGNTPRFPIHVENPGKTVDVASLKMASAE